MTANDDLDRAGLDGPWHDEWAIEATRRPDHGSVINNNDGTFSYTPDVDFAGSDSFRYSITTGEGFRAEPAIVTLVVTPVNDLPVVQNDQGNGFVTDEDVPFVTGSVTANDYDADGSLDGQRVHIVQPPAYGQIAANDDGSFRYWPVADFHGDDAFVYRVVDSAGRHSNSAEVVITVRPVHDAPVANPGLFTTWVDTPIVIPVLIDNHFDIDSGSAFVSISVVETTAFGTLEVLSPEQPEVLTFAPNPGFVGTTSFTYTVTDSAGFVSTPAAVAIVVLPANAVADVNS